MKKLPEIFFSSSKDISLLASEIGISSDNQKVLLDIILKSKQNVLNYINFVEKHSVRVPSIKRDLDTLFRKLYKAKIGIIVNNFTEDGNLIPYKIIITDEASSDFYYYAIEDIFFKTYLGMGLSNNSVFFGNPLTIKNIDPDLLVFKDIFINIKDSDINSEFFNKENKSLNIFIWNSLIIPSGKSDYLVSFSKRIFFIVASNSGVKNIVSRSKNLKIVDYDKALIDAENDISSLINILPLILQCQEEIKSKKTINLSKNWLLFLTFLNHFVSNEKILKDFENEENIKIEKSILDIERNLEKKEIIVNIDELNLFINKYSKEFRNPEKFLNLVKKYFFDSSSKDVFPKIFKIKNNIYLYKPFTYLLFLKEFKDSFVEVKKEIELRVRQVLESGKNASSIFTKDGLNNTIKRFLSNKYVINSYFLNDKAALVDIVVDHYKRITKNQIILIKEKVKVELAKYFGNDTEFFPLYIIYNINLNYILNSSFKELNIFKKMILIFTGKYQSYKEVLSRFSLG